MGDVDVEAIDRRRGYAMMAGGDFATVTNWLSSDGDECSPAEARVAIVEYEGRWFCVDLQDFEPVFTH